MTEVMELTIWPKAKRADCAATKPWAWEEWQDGDSVNLKEGVSLMADDGRLPCVAPPTHAPTPLTCADHACRFLSYTFPPKDSDDPAYARYCIGSLL